jgi:hypothetical protein
MLLPYRAQPLSQRSTVHRGANITVELYWVNKLERIDHYIQTDPRN